jgi:hypothetical protein
MLFIWWILSTRNPLRQTAKMRSSCRRVQANLFTASLFFGSNSRDVSVCTPWTSIPSSFELLRMTLQRCTDPSFLDAANMEMEMFLEG